MASPEFDCAGVHSGRPQFAEKCREQCPSCRKWFSPSIAEAAEKVNGAMARAMAEDHLSEAKYLTTFETHLGHYFDFADPRAEHVHIADIARALSMQVRFKGMVLRFFSVAEHAVNVANEVALRTGDAFLAYAALHHDSHEAYLGDIPTPLKRRLGSEVQALENEINAAIGDALGIDPELFHHPVVKEVDVEMRYREAATLKVSKGVSPHWGQTEAAKPLDHCGLKPLAAEDVFLAIHKEYRHAASAPRNQEGSY